MVGRPVPRPADAHPDARVCGSRVCGRWFGGRRAGWCRLVSVWPQPLLVVADVPASSRWYQQLLGAASNHGGDEYDQLVVGEEIVLQLHTRDGDAAHGPLAAPEVAVGNGVAVWFELADLDAALGRAAGIGASIERPVHVNPLAHHREAWLRDPDGYRVVLAGESEFRPRPPRRP